MIRVVLITFTILALAAATMVNTSKTTQLLSHIVAEHQGFDHHHSEESHSHSHSHSHQEGPSHSHGFEFSCTSPVFLLSELDCSIPSPRVLLLDSPLLSAFVPATNTVQTLVFRPPILA